MNLQKLCRQNIIQCLAICSGGSVCLREVQNKVLCIKSI